MLKNEINDFINRIVGMRQSFPLFLGESNRILDSAKKELTSEIVKLPRGVDKDGNPIRIRTADHVFALGRLHRSVDSLSKANDLLPGVMLMGVVSQFDVFYAHIVRHILSLQPHKVYESQKDFKATDIIKYQSIESFKESLIDGYIDSRLRDSHDEQIRWIESTIGVKLREDDALMRSFIEVTERRNLFVHCDGVVNQQYISVCSRAGIDVSGLNIGARLSVDEKYFQDACDLFIEISFKLQQIIWRSTTKNEASLEADTIAIEIVFNLLVSRNYVLAKTLSCFHDRHCVKNSSQEHKLVFALNLAQCHKWLGEEEEVKRVLSVHSWQAMSPTYQIANFVLIDDFSSAARMMNAVQASDAEFNKSFYSEWPIFQKFIETKDFLDAYISIYGEPFGYKEPVH